MKAFASVVLVFAVCATMVSSSAADEKQLLNVRGDVGIATSQTGAPTQSVSKGAAVGIADSQYAVTGGVVDGQPSQGKIALPDSSVVLVGQSTRVQMASFNNIAGINTAKFILVNGKIRFAVQHPNGAKADYTFTTSTGQIAVRGTVGDIEESQTQLQVNVYQISDPSLPVVVTMNDGKVYKLNAGQTLTIALAGAVVAAGTSAAVGATSQAQQNEFSEFGEAGDIVAGVAASGAAVSGGIPAAAAIAAGAVALGGVIVGVGGHGGGSSPSNPPTGGIVLNPTSLSFTPGTGPLQFTVSETNYTGAFHATISNAAIGIVSGGPAVFTVTPKSDGNTTIDVSDNNGHTSPLDVSVQATTITTNPVSLTFPTLGTQKSFTAQETYYGGSFTANSGDKTVATVNSASSSASGQFNVTSVGPGTTQIAVKDSLGHSTPVSVTVSAQPTPTPTSIPICIGAPVAGMHTTHSRMEPNAPHPAPTQTCPPTPMIAPPVILHRTIPPPQPRPVGPQPPILPPAPSLPGHPTPPPMPGQPPQGA